MSTEYANELLNTSGVITGEMRKKIEAAIMACAQGVDRVHIISGFREGALLREIFSCEGLGTMIYSRIPYQEIRKAEFTDVLSIAEILRESIIKISPEFSEIDAEIENFVVFTVDGHVHGCVKLKEHKNILALEAAYLTVSQAYENSNATEKLLHYAINCAKKKKFNKVFLELSKNTIWIGIYPWLSKSGFIKSKINELGYPKNKSNQKILVCNL